MKSFKSLLYTVNDRNVNDIALRLFQYQAKNNPVYASYLYHLSINPETIDAINKVPFLPISLFKSHVIKTGEWLAEAIFASSGTTGNTTSQHEIESMNFYHENSQRSFNYLFGQISQYHIFALMPSYLERNNSSLVAMLSSFIEKSDSEFSGYYLNEHEKLLGDIERCKKQSDRKVLLWGVSFALLDLAEKFSPDLSGCVILETGGMKGRRKEMIRADLHVQLKKRFNVSAIYSEYGMTELLSQAYTKGGNSFFPPPWMKVIVREVADPFEKGLIGRPGGLNVVDLANIHSVAFIETEDAGKVFVDGSFEVMGRLDNSDVRGCNLMVE